MPEDSVILSKPAQPLRLRPALLGALVAVGLLTWYLWPATHGERVDALIVGDGAVRQAKDELERRFRQEGLVPYVVVVSAAGCRAAIDAAPPHAAVVISFVEPGACASGGGEGIVVQQPGGNQVVAPEGDWTIRAAAPLFNGSDVVPCQWWDTPGAGEARPGLGRCGPDGMVRVLDAGSLTPAGRERFARLVVEAVR